MWRAASCDDGHAVIGIDSFTPYYDVALKEARLGATHTPQQLCRRAARSCRIGGETQALFTAAPADARRASGGATGRSPRLVEPLPYVTSNVVGFLNILEACRHEGVGAPRLRILEFRLWSEPQIAVLRA